MALLMLCLFPMIKTHAGIAQEEMKQLRELREEQEAENFFCEEIKRRLFEHHYSWKQLMEGVKEEGFTIKKVEQSTKHSSRSGMIVKVTFKLDKKNHTRMVYLEKTTRNAH